jgi:hypothetical protein
VAEPIIPPLQGFQNLALLTRLPSEAQRNRGMNFFGSFLWQDKKEQTLD